MARGGGRSSSLMSVRRTSLEASPLRASCRNACTRASRALTACSDGVEAWEEAVGVRCARIAPGMLRPRSPYLTVSDTIFLPLCVSVLLCWYPVPVFEQVDVSPSSTHTNLERP